jgi:hypothetical protein
MSVVMPTMRHGFAYFLIRWTYIAGFAAQRALLFILGLMITAVVSTKGTNQKNAILGIF